VACRLQPDDIRQPFERDRKLAAAGRTETSLDRLARAGNELVVARFAFEMDGGFWQGEDGGISAAARLLAIAAMAVQHDERIGGAFAVDRTAGPPPGEFLRHAATSNIASMRVPVGI
jgi:hypothetical protein